MEVDVKDIYTLRLNDKERAIIKSNLPNNFEGKVAAHIKEKVLLAANTTAIDIMPSIYKLTEMKSLLEDLKDDISSFVEKRESAVDMEAKAAKIEDLCVGVMRELKKQNQV